MKHKRLSISKKIRFEIFKRDSFTCSYCGSKPPSVTLEVDHVIPVFRGGTNEIDNLITSCFDCNRGKGKNELTSLPETTIDKINRLKEQEEQYKEFKKLINNIKNRKAKEIQLVDNVYSDNFKYYGLSENFKKRTLSMFLDKLGIDDVIDSMEIACETIEYPSDAIRYFCGICWTKIKKNG